MRNFSVIETDYRDLEHSHTHHTRIQYQ